MDNKLLPNPATFEDTNGEIEFGKFELIVYPCPFCGHIPDFDFYVNPDAKETWLWKIKCNNTKCPVQPETKYTSIRKTCKRSFSRIWLKVKELQDAWNFRIKKLKITKLIVEHPELVKYIKMGN